MFWEHFAEGWWRYWGTFAKPWAVVLGFALASVTSSLAFDVVKAIFWKVVK